MPNWCENTLAVYGTVEAVKAFTEPLIVSDVSDSGRPKYNLLQTFLPMPDGLRNTDSPVRDPEVAARNIAEHGHSDWHSWALNTWGVKWDVEMTPIDDLDAPDGGAVAGFYFDSAWAPPREGITRISQQFPDLYFFLSWDEPGVDFAGYTWLHRGINGDHEEFPSPGRLVRALQPPDGFDLGNTMTEVAATVAEIEAATAIEAGA